MSKRLQVLMDEAELDETRAVAEQAGMTVSDWVRGVLREARREVPVRSAERKLEALRVAVGYQGPTADIDQVLREIHAGLPTELPE